eukprot:3905682-Pyramimonas_sp.AAC.1
MDATDTLSKAISKLPTESLPVPTVAEVRRASLSFSWRTGLAADMMPPRAYSLLSDEALAMM